MTMTFRVGRSRSFEFFHKVSSFDMNRFGPYVYRKTTKNHDIMICPMYSKAMTFDLDLESQKKTWQEPFLKSTREYNSLVYKNHD